MWIEVHAGFDGESSSSHNAYYVHMQKGSGSQRLRHLRSSPRWLRTPL